MKRLIGLFTLVLALGIQSCGVYSFSGASIDPSVKTITIQNFPNTAPLVVPTLSQTFTEALKQRVLNSTSLGFVRSTGDIELSGQISDYSVKASAVQANQVTSTSRLSISVKVTFINRINTKQNYEQTFTAFSDFSTTQSLSSVQDDLIQKITTQLVDDIFRRTFVNW